MAGGLVVPHHIHLLGELDMIASCEGALVEFEGHVRHVVSYMRLTTTSHGPSSAEAAGQGPPMPSVVDGEPDRVDIAIITVIREEYQALRRLIETPTLASGRAGQPNRYAWEWGTIHSPRYKAPYVVATAFAGAAGTNNGTLATLKTIERWKPRYVLVVGIAGGLPQQDLRKGDVVVSTHIYGYEYGKIEKEFHPRPDQTYQVDGALVTAAVAFAVRQPQWHSSALVAPPEPETEPKVVAGPVASGDKVVDDIGNPFFEAVLRAWPKLQAVEMEGAGAAAAIKSAQEDGHPVGFMMLRGVSDMPRAPDAPELSPGAQTRERDAWKRYAAAVAATFAVSLIRHAWPVEPEVADPDD